MATYIFNFRGTAGYVTDGANSTYVLGETSHQIRNGIEFWWTSSIQGAADRFNGAPSPQLAGANTVVNGASPRTFNVTLPSTGNKTIRLALGDPYFIALPNQKVTLKDGGTTFLTVGPVSPAVGNVVDAAGVEYTVAAWVGSNSAVSHTFTTTAFTLELDALSTYASIVTLEIADAGGGPSPITGTLTQTLGVLTCSATAAAAATGTLTQTLGALTCSSTVRTTSTLYAKAAGGNWSSASTWSAISSAGTDSAGPPDATTPYDVILDAGSGNVTINATASCRSLTCTGYTGTLTHATGVTLAVGHFSPGPSNVLLALAAGMTYSPADITAVVSLNSSVTSPAQTVRSAGQTYGAVTHNGTGSTVLLDALTVTGDLIASDGTFDTAGFTVTCLTYSAAGVGTSLWGASTINITRTLAGIVFAATSTHTINAGTSNIVFSTTSTGLRTFAGGGRTYYDLTYTVAGSTGGLTITGANTFHNLTVSDASNARTLTLPAGATTTVTALAVNGSASKLMSILSSSSPTQATISASSPQSCNYLSLKDSAATGATFYAGTTSTNVSNNAGWLFADPAWTLAQTLGALTANARAITTPYARTVVADGAAGYWPLNERVGATIALDYAGTRPGTLSDGVRSGRPGFWGRAMAFYGQSVGGTPGHIDLGAGPPALATAFSMDFWTNSLRHTGANSHAVIAKAPPLLGDPPEDPGFFALYVQGVHRLAIQANSPASVGGTGSITVNDLAWHHLAFTTDGAGVTKLYIDAVFDVAVSVGFTIDDGSMVTYLGDYPYFQGAGYGWDGLMQAVAWYPTTLTLAQIANHYAAGLAEHAGSAARRPLSVLALAGDDDIMLRYNLAIPITPSDSLNLARMTDAIYVGVTGDLAVVLQNGQARTFVDLAAGSILPMAVSRINATNTTADSLLALYTQ